ncbi:hypothetical protein BGY98DRAFT_983814 [Russula aff. rugulosa BPL654]|nr:hypothetical protein BGY98DRAFT_983814 [Russula aff. rugulosa BPL654]
MVGKPSRAFYSILFYSKKAANSQVKLNGDGMTSADLTSQVLITSSRASRAPCLAVMSKEAGETGHVTNRSHYGSFLQLAFMLRRFVVDVDTQFLAIFHLQYNPGFSNGSDDILGLFGFKHPIVLHVIIPHSQSFILSGKGQCLCRKAVLRLGILELRHVRVFLNRLLTG